MARLILLTIFLSAVLLAQKKANPLDHTKWKLVKPEGKVTLTFEKDRFGIKACNVIGGGYRLKKSRIISTGPPIGTMMACPEEIMQFDKLMTDALTQNRSFRIKGDQLILTAKDKTQMEFAREPMASAHAVTKFIYVASELKDCTGVSPMKCLQIRDSEDEPWRLHYGQIIGFEHQPGIEYRLRIKEDKVERPAADQSSVIWYLDLVVEQKVVKN